MNGQPHWTLNQSAGTIQASPLAGTCNALRPADGIQSVSIQATPLPDARLLAPSLLSVAADSPEPPEVFARGQDLAAIYPPTAEFPFRTQAYWRLDAPSKRIANSPILASCELIASTQTDLLESRPDIFVTSTLPVSQVFRLDRPLEMRFTELKPAAQGREFTAADGTGCLVYRLANVPFSYVEIVHPQDFTATRFELERTDHRLLATARHHLFAHNLEKGVVLRARVLGLWMPADGDFQTTLVCYQEFAVSEPPLTA